jgi:sulfite reductase (NADPH) flavoprotein alpha-component
MKIPTISSDAPYSASQRAWLSGFFAGMHSQLLQSANTVVQTEARVVNILYGSQTGNAQSVANDAATAAKAHGLKPLVHSMDEITAAQLSVMATVLLITSTYGEGEMPDSVQMLWDEVAKLSETTWYTMHYAVFALGDTSYDLFCEAGKNWDNKLAELGALRLFDRVDCDVDYEEPAQAWLALVVPHISGTQQTAAVLDMSAPLEEKPQYHRKHPFPAALVVNRLLTAPHSSKETRHYEISIAGSGLHYEAGDALCVIPSNCPTLVTDIIAALACQGDEDEPVKGELMSLRDALSTHYEIKTPSKEFIEELAKRSGDQHLNGLVNATDKQALSDFLWGRDTLDLLRTYPICEFSAAEFLGLLKPLQHRAYSISSSSKVSPDTVHLTVASVRYHSGGRDHKGVCSTFLADLVTDSTKVKCFFLPNKVFRVPEDNTVPMIMVGPGTGIAPFRAFLQERQARQAIGKNWLFFGDRNADTDFIYQDELNAFKEQGVLTRLELAFSRDQEDKIYVQDKMREHGAELFAWLVEGGYFFVCGDAYRMAKDVDNALHQLIATHGNLSEQQALDYVNQLKKEKRYVRDVY